MGVALRASDSRLRDPGFETYIYIYNCKGNFRTVNIPVTKTNNAYGKLYEYGHES